VEAFVDGLWTVDDGVGMPVLLCSGGPGCCDYLEPVGSMLAGVARTIRFDARGCGRSAGSDAYTLAGSLADVERIREYYGIKSWVVLGHSAGADLSLAYALAEPERTMGFVCLSGGRVHDDRSWHAAYAAGRDAGLEIDIDYAFPPNLEVNRQLNVEWKAYIKRRGLLRDLSMLERPALFVYGSEDIRPSWPAEQLAALLPKAEMEMLAGAGHNLWLTHGEELERLVTAFLRQMADGVGIV
jgi:proline iminopeptidase